MVNEYMAIDQNLLWKARDRNAPDWQFFHLYAEPIEAECELWRRFSMSSVLSVQKLQTGETGN